MCGRFTLKARAEVLAEQFRTARRTVVRAAVQHRAHPAGGRLRPNSDGPGRELAALRWGPIPSWADDSAIGNRMINARAETVAEKPTYRVAFRQQRCLIPADGFFEWKAEGRGKQPWYFRLADGGPFEFAGLWERWTKGGEPVESCALITTEANGVVGPVHNRMPVMLAREDYARWLDPHTPGGTLGAILRPCPDELLAAHPVGRWVNDPRHDDPRCVEPG